MELFENIKHINPKSGIEYWFARDIQPVLGYADWNSFTAVIAKAWEACKTAGINTSEHFGEVKRNFRMPDGSIQETGDIGVTRYACYLIAQCGDPSKEVNVKAQAYFAQTEQPKPPSVPPQQSAPQSVPPPAAASHSQKPEPYVFPQSTEVKPVAEKPAAESVSPVKTSLINCLDCGREISAKAPACIHCGCPIVNSKKQTSPTEKADSVFESGGSIWGDTKNSNDTSQTTQSHQSGTGSKDSTFKLTRTTNTKGSVIAAILIVSVVAYLVLRPSEQPTQRSTPAPQTTPAVSAHETQSSNEEEHDLIKALNYNLDVARGNRPRVTGLLDENAGDYHGISGALLGLRVNASMNAEAVQEYRTLYYALHWRGAYISEFGEDEYMRVAEAHISDILSESEIEEINSSFSRVEQQTIVDAAEYKINSTTVSYDNLVRRPDDYIGEVLAVRIRVTQIMGEGDGFFAALLESGYHGREGNNEWFIKYELPEGASRVLEGDTITFYGEFDGLRQFTRAIGGTRVSLPQLNARYHE